MRKVITSLTIMTLCSLSGITLITLDVKVGVNLTILLFPVLFSFSYLPYIFRTSNSKDLEITDDVDGMSLEQIKDVLLRLELNAGDDYNLQKVKDSPRYKKLKEMETHLLSDRDKENENRRLEILYNAKDKLNEHDVFLSAYQISPDSSIGNLPLEKEQEIEEIAQKIASKIIKQHNK